MSTELDIFKQEIKAHRCSDWPDLAEERDQEQNTEEFSDILLKNILEHDPKYAEDAKSAIKFIENIVVPGENEVVLTNSRGCRICHHDLIDNKVHYVLIKGLCDIKTVQYYLFSKHVFFKSWYIKKHLKHININKIKIVEKLPPEKDIDIINMNIRQITNELKEFERQGGVKDNVIVINLRKDLKEWMQLKSNLDVAEEQKKNVINFDEMMEIFNRKNG